MDQMDLLPNNLYYNINENVYYIGNGNIFIQGVYFFQTNIIEITYIKSCHKYNIEMIVSFSYMKVASYKFDNIDDAINFNEMIKMWNTYNNYYLDIYYTYAMSFKLVGNILNQIQYKNVSLFDIILYKKIISKDDLIINSCFTKDKKEKINKIYNKIIFKE
jgi:hypothetical protein